MQTNVIRSLNIGKSVRMERIFNRDTLRTIIIQMDHGIGAGPIKGLTDLSKMVNKVAEGGANAVLGHIGLSKYGHRGYGRDIGLIIHMSASTSMGPNPNHTCHLSGRGNDPVALVGKISKVLHNRYTVDEVYG